MLKKFLILDIKDDSSLHIDEVEILLNLDNIVSLKPIRISVNDKLLDGFWLRMTNGKKYKATKIPNELVKELQTKEISGYQINTEHIIEESLDEDFMH